MITNNEDPPGGDELDVALGEFRRMPVPDRPPDEDVLARLGSLAAASASPVPGPLAARKPFLRHPGTYAAAIAAVVLVGWAMLTTGAPMAFANVAQAVTRYKLVRHKQTQTTDHVAVPEAANATAADASAPDTRQTSVSTVYQDLQAPRSRTELRDPRTGAISLDIKDCAHGRRLMMQADTKEATILNVDCSTVRLLVDVVHDFAENRSVTTEKATLDGTRVRPVPAGRE